MRRGIRAGFFGMGFQEMNIGIIESDNFSKKAIDQLNLIGKVSTMDKDSLHSFIEDKEVLFVRLKRFISKDLLNKAPNLKYLCTPTTGLIHIDLEETDQRNIKVISLKGEQQFLSNIRATPEHAFGLTLALLRNYKAAVNGPWDRDQFIGSEIYNNRIGLIGMGRVGGILAGYFNQFGAEVFFSDPFISERNIHMAHRIDVLKDLIRQTNIVILCSSYNKANEGFIDKEIIDTLKGKYFVNIARGELVDEEYLMQKIEQDYFMGIALDVICNETHENNYPQLLRLTDKHHLILTPHIGGATSSSMHRTEEFIVQKLMKHIGKN